MEELVIMMHLLFQESQMVRCLERLLAFLVSMRSPHPIICTRRNSSQQSQLLDVTLSPDKLDYLQTEGNFSLFNSALLFQQSSQRKQQPCHLATSTLFSYLLSHLFGFLSHIRVVQLHSPGPALWFRMEENLCASWLLSFKSCLVTRT